MDTFNWIINGQFQLAEPCVVWPVDKKHYRRADQKIAAHIAGKLRPGLFVICIRP